MTITIAKLARVATWNSRGESIPAYLLTSDRNGGKPICAEPAAWLGTDEAVPELAPAGTIDDLDPRASDQYAVLVAGEIYDLATATVIRPTDGDPIDSRLWFNIACQGTALAKMRLLGYDPEDDLQMSPRGTFRARPHAEARIDERQATLKMLTAKYCGDVSYTEAGTLIGWTKLTRAWLGAMMRGRRRVQWRKAASDDLGDIEARWTKDGAVCLSQPRLAIEDAATIRSLCGIAACGPRKIRTVEQDPAKVVYWTSYAGADPDPITEPVATSKPGR